MAPGPSRIDCFFDGACKGNQFSRKGPMWVAYVVGDEQHAHEIPDVVTAQGPQRSNNLAECQALLLLLRLLRQTRPGWAGTRYVVYGDSQLVVYQMLGRYRVSDAKLLPLHQEAKRLAEGLLVIFRWVPRERNPAGHLLE